MKAAGPADDSKIILIVEYDGTGYHGSQLQKNAPTVQEEIEKALKKLTGERIRVKAASRTDAGVHARGQVFGFRTQSKLPLTAFVDGLNHYLPRDIAVRESHKADGAFDVRRAATSREYRYSILNSQTRSPLRQTFSHRVGGRLNVAAMQRACRALVGKHDFASFAAEAATAGKSTVREVHRASIKRDGDMIVFDMTANSFLPHQVRNTVGPLLRVGQGKMTVQEFENMITARTPGLAWPTAPAAGLCLMKVNYPVPWGDAK